MRFQDLLMPTLRELPADAEIASHQLMLRAGLIRKLASGIYTFLPLGLKILRKVEKIVREEMDAIGAQEILMPSIIPSELWEETGRWDFYGKELLRISDRHSRNFCYGPTHEEVITDLFRREIRSYKQLPICFYQIQTKFRDEVRPRFGIMRAREFLMKDAYSFHLDQASLQQTYMAMYHAYQKIFTRLGLEFRAVMADTGSIGGNASHEFQVLAASGEDIIAISDGSDYAANIELAEALPAEARNAATLPITKVATPGQETIAQITEFLKCPAHQQVKTLIVKGKNHPAVALILRGDHELNPFKAEKHPWIASPLTFVNKEDIFEFMGADAGSLGPVASLETLKKLNIPVVVDRDAAVLSNFTCGANENGFHYQNVNWHRDATLEEIADLRFVIEGDRSPDNKGHLKFVRGIEVGHVFQLGKKYSEAMKAQVLNENGEEIIVEMGCYGIGVSRIIAAAIEQHHDERGIIWPKAMAPFDIVLIPLINAKNQTIAEISSSIYNQLGQNGFDVLLDDREERPGVKFADADLLGIPLRIVISEKTLAENAVECKRRWEKDAIQVPLDRLMSFCHDEK